MTNQFTRDHAGALVQQLGADYEYQLEGGDSLNWTGHYVYLGGNAIQCAPRHTYFKKGTGYVRHPNTGFASSLYYKNFYNGNISRDQYAGLLAYLITDSTLKEKLQALLPRFAWAFLFTYNTIKNSNKPVIGNWKLPDLTLFMTWSIELRLFPKLAALLKPLLNILDLHMLVNTLVFNKFGKEDTCPLTFALFSIIIKEHSPTFVSKLAWKKLDKAKLLRTLDHYWCGWRKQPGMYQLFEDRIDLLDIRDLKEEFGENQS